MTHRPVRPLALLAALLVLVAACDKPGAIGDANSIIVVAPAPAWEALEEDILAALEPRTFTVRDERIFQVTHISPDDPRWRDLRELRQVILIGEPGDEWMADALDRVEGAAPRAPAMARATDVWARGQVVTLLLVPPGGSPDAVRPLVPALGEELVTAFRRYAQQRMFASGVDTVSADSLGRKLGFSLLLPQVYRPVETPGGGHLFRNDQPDPSKLIRSVYVTSVPSAEVPLTPEAALEWRARIAGEAYEPPQVTDPEQAVPTAAPGEAVQVQGVWSNPPEGFPAAGPFLTRLVPCPAQGRTYLLDAWLYAPGRDKFEYMVQLETILDSFACTAGG